MDIGKQICNQLTDKQQRWASFLSSCLVMCGLGSIYAISAWNNDIKDYLHYSQAEISLVNSMANFGKYFGVAIGCLHDYIGPHQSMGIGAVGIFILYGFIYLFLTYSPQHMSSILFGIALLLVGQLTDFGVLAALGHNNSLFGGENRGKVSGSLLAWFAIAGVIFAAVYRTFYFDNVVGFFLFLTMSLTISLALGYLFLYHDENALPHHTAEKKIESNEAKENLNVLHTPSTSTIKSVGNYNKINKDEEITTPVKEEIENITGLKLMMDLRFWLVFTVLFCIVGAAMFANINISFINESYHGTANAKIVLVMVFSLVNCVARVICGAVSDSLVHKVPRAAFCGIAAIITIFAQILFLCVPANGLIFPIVFSGLANGMVFAVYACITREYFGPVNFGKNYTLLACAIAIGFPLFISPISSKVYSHHAQMINGKEKCTGRECFRFVFYLNILTACIALAASILLCIKAMRAKKN